MSRYLVVSDMHGNSHALEGVLAAAPPATWDGLIVLGDLVGYGADPNGVVERIRALDPRAIVRGNHDKVACGLEPADDFNSTARQAAMWTAQALTPANRDYLRGLPAGPLRFDDRLEICHGMPSDEDAYVFDGADALDALEAAVRPVCLFGHTHLPVVYAWANRRITATMPSRSDTMTIELDRATRYLINPGSVGQPRDGDPRAAFAIYDDEAACLMLRRTEYPIERAQEAILAAGLPRVLATRLAAGR